MGRQLTQKALKKLNELVASGVPFKDAMAQTAAWEEASVSVPSAPKPPIKPTTTLAEATERIDAILAELRDVGVVPDEPGNGCSPEEIAALERDTKRSLPYAYKHLLTHVGKARTRLISHDHIAFELHRLRTMQNKGAAFMARGGFEKPPNAFFLLSALGDAYHYMSCDDPDAVDAAIWVAREDLDAPFLAYPSILDLVQSLSDDAFRAWNSGYFKAHPQGTQA